MPDSEPVLVIHGVANRDQDDFKAQVAEAEARVNAAAQAPGRWKFIPVYWGDLGARDADIQDTLPVTAASVVDLSGLMGGLISTTPSSRARRELVSRTAREEIHLSPVALPEPAVVAGTVREAIEEGWPQTRWLQRAEDEALLREVGRAVGLGARDYAALQLTAGASPADLKDFTRGLLGGLDNSFGTVLGSVVGRLEDYFRTQLLPRTTEFLGDVFVYQRNQARVQETLWDALKENAAGWGTPDQPVSVIGHSMGGVIAFDTATGGQPPLYIKSFITLGSQPSYFQVLDPQRDGLPPYTHGNPIPLPPSIGRWTNFWEPLDILAFAVGKVFVLHNGTAPEDVAVPHLAAAGLLPHNWYWTDPFVIARMAVALQ